METEIWRPILAIGLLLGLVAITASAESSQPSGSAEPISEAFGLFSDDEIGDDENLPVIVIFKDGAKKELEDLDVKRTYNIINGVSGTANSLALERLAADPNVAGVYPDGKVEASQLTNATADNKTFCASGRVNVLPLWDRGINGSGVVVAVLDSGIDKNHPDLAGKVVGEVNFVDTERTTDDLLGHGTAVAGLIAGSGTASGGEYVGTAPGASLLNVRVIDSEGSGQISDIIAGIDWAVENDADVLTMSLGGLNLGESNPPISMAADNAMDAGTVVCVAAGNLDERLLLLMMVASSVSLGGVESPGDGVKVITVGATDCDDRIADFSGSGPLRDGRYKPTLVAPGVNVVSTVPPNLDVEGKIDNYYAGSSGTSLSTPVVAGVAALLIQAEPDLTPAGVKAALTRGAKKLLNTQDEEYEAYYQGAGLLDAEESFEILRTGLLCGVVPDHWSAGRWVYGDFWVSGDDTVYGSLDTGADRYQKKMYALAPGDVDWNSRFLFFTDKDLSEVTTTASGATADWTMVQPLPEEIPANGQRVFGASISVPEDAAPGRYTGSIDVAENGSTIFSVPLNVDVAEPMEMIEGRGRSPGTLNKGEWDYYYVEVPTSTDELKCTLSWDGETDLDLFLLSPTSEYHPASQEEGAETVSVETPPTGRWLVAAHARNATEKIDYVLEVERTLLDTTPKRWSVGSAGPGETKEATFGLKNGGPSLTNVTYVGMMEMTETETQTFSIRDREIMGYNITVPANITRFDVSLSWDDPDSVLALILANQNKTVVDVTYGSDVQAVGVNHPAPGDWMVIIYGYDVTTKLFQPADMEVTFYVQDTWSWVAATGPEELNSGMGGTVNATITIPSNASSASLEGYIQIRSDEDRFTIPISLTVGGASLTGASTTDLVDKDGDGRYEKLCVDVGVDVTIPGEYRVEGSLLDGNGSAIGWFGSTKRLEEDGSIEICVNGSEIESSGRCGPLSLENLVLYNGNGDIIDRYEGNITIFKCPEDFQPLSAGFTGEFADETPSETGTKPDSFIISVGVAVQTPGSYEIAGELVDDDDFEVDRAVVTADLEEGEEGTQTVTLTFSPIRFIMKKTPSRLHLTDLTLSRDGEVLDEKKEAFSTEAYNPEDFTTAKKTYVIS